ncbi:MAG: tRNA uridine-5-carboxymethylaminomethyl(34) synthesis GTPase MnmE [Candidatus Bipolaricaulota bacterium]|nr:tRNA uridine-5-carboxymethylaminomethyl(34) synthesis GTPase MnmE [Candidatus Bipolaricaulota bacterium]MBS3791947.1 tRNA uridine-5-carboxymethylaminomethyl(34) synthesis GTPase MnmE [Candidatus Bipolaricaulota bacterium]
MNEEETIAAISTPLGKSGIGIVRLSGPEALGIAGKLFTSPDDIDLAEVESHTLHYGYVQDPWEEKEIDEVLVSVMKAPRTYTREDVAEINCHGGVVPLRETLELALDAGARPAEPGEFTKRAFLNGRLTLDQAKSVKDIIDSKTRFSLELSLDRLEGKFSDFLSSVREELTAIMARIEMMIDFPDYEESIISREELEEKLSELEGRIEDFLAHSKDGRILKEGHKIAVLGRPNVGKSTLLNTLLREERAIVSPTPGTTRDTLEEELEIDGIPFRVTDTAGIRQTEGEIERQGVRRAKEQGRNADISLLLVDVNSGVTPEDVDIAEEIDKGKTILVLNKIDLVDNLSVQEILPKMGSGWAGVVDLSAKEGQGLKNLESAITELVWGGEVRKDESLVLLNVQEKELLKRAKKGLASARDAIKEGRSIDLVEIDIREARKDLGKLLGEDLSEEVLNRVFSDFCVGK